MFKYLKKKKDVYNNREFQCRNRNYFKIQMKILELRNIISDLKISLAELNNILEKAVKKVIKLID